MINSFDVHGEFVDNALSSQSQRFLDLEELVKKTVGCRYVIDASLLLLTC